MVALLDSVFSIHDGRSILACRSELGGWILLKYLSLGQIWSLESLYHLSSPPPSHGLCSPHLQDHSWSSHFGLWDPHPISLAFFFPCWSFLRGLSRSDFLSVTVSELRGPAGGLGHRYSHTFSSGREAGVTFRGWSI